MMTPLNRISVEKEKDTFYSRSGRVVTEATQVFLLDTQGAVVNAVGVSLHKLSNVCKS
jgi:hypothetical protein